MRTTARGQVTRPDHDSSAQAGMVVAALTRALTGMTLRARVLTGAAREQFDARPILSREQIVLARHAFTRLQASSPSGVANATDDLIKATAAHAAAHLLFSEPQRPVEGLKPMGIAVISAIEDARVEALLCSQFPGAQRWFLRCAANASPSPVDSFSDRIARLSRALLDPDCRDDDYWIGKARQLFSQCVRDCGLEDYWAFRRLGSILANDLGQMRVRFNPAEYVVPFPYRDDNSFLWTDPGAQPLAVAPAIQETTSNASSAPSSVSEPVTSAQQRALSESQLPVHYPEWDYRSGLLRQAWATVFETVAGPPPAPDATPPHNLLHRRASTVRKLGAWGHMRRRRQPDGDALDLDAAIRNVIDRRMAGYSDERHYVRREPHPKAISVLVLIDLSESANDAAGAGGARVLDLAVAAALSLAQALAHGPARIAVHGFCSNTRANVSYERFLDFGVGLDEQSRTLLLGASARESTRMGAALRHAQRFLSGESSARRMLVVLSDGVPSDIDVFDPRYLARDAARAVADLRRSGVDVCCITPVPTQALTAREVFGANNVLRVISARTLPSALARFVGRRMAQ